MIRFKSVYEKISQALDDMPQDEIGLSEEVKEQVNLFYHLLFKSLPNEYLMNNLQLFCMHRLFMFLWFLRFVCNLGWVDSGANEKGKDTE